MLSGFFFVSFQQLIVFGWIVNLLFLWFPLPQKKICANVSHWCQSRVCKLWPTTSVAFRLSPDFINKMLLEHIHTHLFTCCFCTTVAGLSNCEKDHVCVLQGTGYLLSDLYIRSLLITGIDGGNLSFSSIKFFAWIYF